MTYQDHFTLPTELLEQVASEGLDAIPELLRVLVNAAMQVERQKHLGAGRYERSPQRQGHANGYKPKTVTTRMGKITFDVPQVREGGFYPGALEKGLRSERAFNPSPIAAMAQTLDHQVFGLRGQQQPFSLLAVDNPEERLFTGPGRPRRADIACIRLHSVCGSAALGPVEPARPFAG